MTDPGFRFKAYPVPGAAPEGSDAGRANIASQHLLAAALFARQACAIAQRDQAILSESDVRAQLAYALGSVVSSAAFIECTINELFKAVSDGDTSLLGDQRTWLADAMRAAWPEIERLSPLAKHDVALALAKLSPFDKGQPPYQTAATLVAFRNSLVHFKPEWDDQLVGHKKIEDRLRGLFPLNSSAPQTAPAFPYKYLGYGAAKWAVQSARGFVEDFATRMGVGLRLAASGNLIEPDA